jgi:hypothetical protein
MNFRIFLMSLFFLLVFFSKAQLYVLKNAPSDSRSMKPVLFQDLPVLCDSFHTMLTRKDASSIKDFVPDVNYLKMTFDTLALDFRADQVIVKQQMILRGLQRDYRKIQKKLDALGIKFLKLGFDSISYRYGSDDNNNKYCYVTHHYSKRKNQFTISYIAIVLNDHWFVGDKLELKIVE